MKLPDEIREFFRRQGSIGGRKRSEMLSPEERRELARRAVQTRWDKQKQEKLKKSSRKTSPKKGDRQ